MQSAKTNLNVEEVFFSIAKDIKQRLAESDSKSEVLITCRGIFSFRLLLSFQKIRFMPPFSANPITYILRMFLLGVAASDN